MNIKYIGRTTRMQKFTKTQNVSRRESWIICLSLSYFLEVNWLWLTSWPTLSFHLHLGPKSISDWWTIFWSVVYHFKTNHFHSFVSVLSWHVVSVIKLFSVVLTFRSYSELLSKGRCDRCRGNGTPSGRKSKIPELSSHDTFTS